MFRGEHINVTEDRAVLHVALRMPAGALPRRRRCRRRRRGARGAAADGRSSPRRCATGVASGHTGRPIRNVVNIGIGGSDLGPSMAYDALRAYSRRDMQFRFVSNVDGADLVDALDGLDAAETLFIVSSKTFTTLETITNASAGARVVARHDGRRRSRGRRVTSSRCPPTRRRSPSSASTPPTCSSSGTGSAAATRCGRRSGCR